MNEPVTLATIARQIERALDGTSALKAAMIESRDALTRVEAAVTRAEAALTRVKATFTSTNR